MDSTIKFPKALENKVSLDFETHVESGNQRIFNTISQSYSRMNRSKPTGSRVYLMSEVDYGNLEARVRSILDSKADLVGNWDKKYPNREHLNIFEELGT